jgi:hypothetical protein
VYTRGVLADSGCDDETVEEYCNDASSLEEVDSSACDVLADSL